MMARTHSTTFSERRHLVREQLCRHHPARVSNADVLNVSTAVLADARTTVQVLAPLLGDETVEVFGVACLSVSQRLLAWHVVYRGTRRSAAVSVSDVFVPALLTRGTSGLVVIHNCPNGDPTPSSDDARLTVKLSAAADILDVGLLDHLIVAQGGRFFSFREAGTLARAHRLT
jgi:DNA repair protein RadC